MSLLTSPCHCLCAHIDVGVDIALPLTQVPDRLRAGRLAAGVQGGSVEPFLQSAALPAVSVACRAGRADGEDVHVCKQ